MKLKQHEQKLSEARKRVRELDILIGPNRSIKHIISALENGLKYGIDHESVYDALYMLMDVQSSITILDELNNVNLKDVFMAMDIAKPVRKDTE